jgi:thimet oligopeptidase
MDTAATLFQVTFRQEQNIPSWDPSVETWDLLDNGKIIGRFYLDMHPREGKFSHAEMVPALDGIRENNYRRQFWFAFPNHRRRSGADGVRRCRNLFHELGHLMH